MRSLSLIVAFVLVVATIAQAGPHYIGQFPFKNAAFLNLGRSNPNADIALILTSFTGNPFGSDGIGIVPSIGGQMNNISALRPSLVTKDVTWPNDVVFNTVPSAPLANDNSLIAPYGFLVPPKTVGGVKLLQLDETLTKVTSSYKLSKDKGGSLDGWFYHEAKWVDMNGDGRLDILTARSTKPLFGKMAGEMLWLEQPSTNPLIADNLPWKEHVIASGPQSPDVFFELYDIDGDGLEEILHTCFFSGSGFGVLYSDASGPNRWDNSSGSVKEVVVDTSIGQAYGLQLYDLNNDKKLDVLVSNHVDNATTPGAVSGVWAYEIPFPPLSFKDPSNWKRHNITTGFVVREWGPAQAAPGAATAFHPYPKYAHETKPHILVEGDGDQRLYTVTPLSEDSSDWHYNRTEIFDCHGTVGKFAIADVDHDGAVEIFCPCFDKGFVATFSYAK